MTQELNNIRSSYNFYKTTVKTPACKKDYLKISALYAKFLIVSMQKNITIKFSSI